MNEVEMVGDCGTSEIDLLCCSHDITAIVEPVSYKLWKLRCLFPFCDLSLRSHNDGGERVKREGTSLFMGFRPPT